MYYVYILTCADDTLYVGSTNNIEQRLYAHNNLKTGAHYTKIRRPVALVYTEECADRGSAQSREAELKKLSRAEKQALISSNLR